MKIWRKCLGLLFVFCCAGSWAEIPSATVRKVEISPVIDGKLDDPAWAEAQSYSMSVLRADGTATDETSFKITCDDTWLYIAVDCRNADLLKIRESLGPKVIGHDQGAGQDDSIEFFLDPGTDGKLYFHYMLSWAGAKDERRVVGRAVETGWNVPWRSATEVTPQGWTGELALPLYVLTAFNPPDTFRFNLTRNKRIPEIDGSGVIVNETKEWHTFAPVVRSFHEPAAFVALSGIPAKGLKIPFLVELKKTEILPYQTEAGENYYEVMLELEGKNHLSGQVLIKVIDEPAVGAKTEITELIELTGESLVKKIIRVPAENLSERDVEIYLQTADKAEILCQTKYARPQALHVMRVYPDRSYYTTEAAAAIICELGLPAPSLPDYALHIVTAAGTEIGQTTELSPETHVPAELGELGLGETVLSVELRRKADQQRFFACDLSVVKREPRPGCEWKIDHLNRVVLNNEKPFFPLGLIMSKVSYEDEKDFQRVAEAGFNTYLQWSHIEDTADALKYLEVLKKHNLYYIENPDFHVRHFKLDGIDRFFEPAVAAELHKINFKSYFAVRRLIQGRGGFNAHFQTLTPSQQDELYIEYYHKNMPRILDVVDKVQRNPLLTSYFIMDEDEDRNSRAIGRQLYRQIHETDGYHPVIRNFSSYIGDITDCFDVIMTDPYWSPGRAGMGVRGTPDFVAKITWMTFQRGEKYRQPVWQTLVGNVWSGLRKRTLTNDEHLNQCYLAVIHGASGLFFFYYPFSYQEGWDAMYEVCRRFNVIGPLANSGRIAQTVAYQTAALDAPEDTPAYQTVEFDYWKDIYPEVHTCVLQLPDHEYLLLAANARYYPVTTTFAIDGISGTAEPLFNGESRTVKDGSFAETIEPLGVRAYKLKGASEPVNVQVKTTHLKKDVPPAETIWVNEYRPDKKNEMVNPSFEDAAIKGWPDYCFPAFSHDMDHLSGTDNPSWGQVSEQPYHGAKCLILRYPIYATHIHCSPNNDKPLPYTISFWARANRAGVNLWLFPQAMERLPGIEYDYKAGKTFELTTEWQRYEHSALLPARVHTISRTGNILDFRVNQMEEGDTVWLDAVQFEKGTQATEFEE